MKDISINYALLLRSDVSCGRMSRLIWEGTSGGVPDFTNAGITHFTPDECLQLKRAGLRAPWPPREWWARFVPPLLFAEAFRALMHERAGYEIPISIGNGFRPSPRHPKLHGYMDLNKRVGGARGSKHIVCRAIDMDPIVPKGKRVSRRFVHECAADVYNEVKDSVTIGMGFYRGSKRVHVDIGPQDRELMGFLDRMRDTFWGSGSKILKEGKAER